MDAIDINKLYPTKDERWQFDRLIGRWSTDISDFKDVTLLDPWRRPFSDIPRVMKDVRENEIVGWLHTTTVKGIEVECAVIND